MEDVRHSREAFAALKASLPNGQLPVLTLTGEDGKVEKIAQSSAILRLICSLGGLHPSEPAAAARVDALVAMEADTLAAYRAVKYPGRYGLGGLDAAALDAAMTAVSATVVPTHLANLEKLVGDGWLAGTEKPSAADFAWASSLRELRVGAMVGLDPAILEPLPRTRAWLDRFLALPAVQAYYVVEPAGFGAAPAAAAPAPAASGRRQPGSPRSPTAAAAAAEKHKPAKTHAGTYGGPSSDEWASGKLGRPSGALDVVETPSYLS